MGGRGASSATAAASRSVGARPTINATAMSDQAAAAIAAGQDAVFTIDQTLAVKQYISAASTGNGYSMSQNMNYNLENGIPLNANERFVDNQLSSAMHPIGQDTVLHRGAHSDVLARLGVQNYQSMTDSQLKSALIGSQWTSKSYYSTSYDLSKNPFLSGAQAGGREVVMRLHTAGSANAVFANRKQAEVILAKGTNFAITNASFTGQTVHPRVGGAMRQVVLDVDVW